MVDSVLDGPERPLYEIKANLFKALPIALLEHVHPLRHRLHHLITQHGHQALRVVAQAQLRPRTGQQTGHAHRRHAGQLRQGSL